MVGSVGGGLAWRRSECQCCWRSPLSSAGWRDVAAPPGAAGRDYPGVSPSYPVSPHLLTDCTALVFFPRNPSCLWSLHF